jgi:hypothetical protein
MLEFADLAEVAGMILFTHAPIVQNLLSEGPTVPNTSLRKHAFVPQVRRLDPGPLKVLQPGNSDGGENS